MGSAGWKHQQLFLTAALLPSRHSGDAPGAEATGRSVGKPNRGNTLLGNKQAKAWVRFCTPLCREGMPPGWGVWWIHDVSAYVLEEGVIRAPEESVSCLLSVLQSPPVLLLSFPNVKDQILFVYITCLLWPQKYHHSFQCRHLDFCQAKCPKDLWCSVNEVAYKPRSSPFVLYLLFAACTDT